MKKKNVLAISSILLLIAMLVFVGCGGSGSGGSSSSGGTSYLGTQSPGDVWTWNINRSANTFSATNETNTYTYSGTVATLPNDFLILTVMETTDPGLTPPEVAYAFEVPDTALIVKPAEPDSKVIVAVKQGECLTQDATYNWVVMPWNGWNGSGDGAYGVTDITVNGSSYDLSHQEYEIDNDPKPAHSETGITCAEGRIDDSSDPDSVIGVTPSGVIIGDHGPGQGGFVGFEAPASNIAISAAALAGKEFRGVVFKNGNDSGEDTEPVWARANPAGGIDGGHYTDFDNGVESTPMVHLAFVTQSSPGVVTGTLTDLSFPNTENFTFMVSEINGKYFIFGIAAEGGDNSRPYNFLVMEN